MSACSSAGSDGVATIDDTVAGPAEVVAEPPVELADTGIGDLQDASAFAMVPPVEVFDVETPLVLDPVGYCWGDECASGDWTQEPLPSAGVVENAIGFRYPVAGWSFSAFVQGEGGEERTPATVESLGNGEFRIASVENPTGPVVELFGQGPAGEFGGDVTVVFLVDW